jgi:hypothetical protein
LNSLPRIYGRLNQIPDEISNSGNALVYEVIPTSHKSLGLPPSFDTVTRDTYPPDRAFDLRTVTKIALSISSAAAYIHSRGISHGDIYAHNILLDTETGNAMLVDFGAGSMYPLTHPEGNTLQRIEVRAFGYLLEELIERIHPHINNENENGFQKCMTELLAIKERCLLLNVSSRPLFEELTSLLQELMNKFSNE